MSTTASSSTDGDLPDTAMTTPSVSRIVTGHHESTRDGMDESPDCEKVIPSLAIAPASDDQSHGQAAPGAERPAKVSSNGDLESGAKDKAVAGVELPDEEDVPSHHEYETDGEDQSVVASDLANEVRYRFMRKKSLDERRKSAKKRNLQAGQYLILIEDRLKELEEIVTTLQAQQASEKSKESQANEKDKEDPVLPSPEPEKLLIEPAKLTWEQFCAPDSGEVKERQAVIDFLVEPPYPFDKELKLATSSNKHLTSSSGQLEGKPVERVRLNCSCLVDVLRDILDHDSAPRTGEANLKPFKAIVPYVDALRAKADELKSQITKEQTHSDSADNTVAVEDGASGSPPRESTGDGEDAAKSGVAETEESMPKPDSETTSPTLKTSTEKLEHLNALIESVQKELGAECQTHELLRSRHKGADTSTAGTKVSFHDLWHLFAPGDLIYDPLDNQALQVLAVRGGRQLLNKGGPSRHRDAYLRDSDESNAAAGVTAIAQLLTADDQISDFVLTCFYLDFNGTCVGPVHSEKRIEPFDGTKDIKSLAVMPIEYADPQAFRVGRTGAGGASSTTQSVQEILIARGRKFASLARSQAVSHRDYSGLSLGKVRDQIDSQVIIDLDLYYQKHPDYSIELGLREPAEGDVKEIEEPNIKECYCGSSTCPLNHSSNIFDDRKVDKFRTSDFLGKHQFLVRFTEPRSQHQMLHRDDCVVLFPRMIFGYVLRSRTWVALDVGRIADLQPRTQSFKELVLPPEHKKIVEALVRTHSRGAHSVEDAAGGNNSGQREDLVRGKGKGVILLLHGVPGVGKTSTAECVAEYTKRPLFALTCGDIGDNAIDVEKNLTENFQLAHRWGCVMLLDEADVFLQSRSRDRDLGRNAVVSVFLGMLEYYSGILFLTTNKIGTFDEAFKSRIHVSLYYQELNRNQTMEIWSLNLDRILETRKDRVSFNRDDMIEWMKKFYKRSKKSGARPWNGRQIKNACQTAAALAEFQNEGKPKPAMITEEELKAVAEASAQFDKYLKATHGTDDAGRAEAKADRGDDKFAAMVEGAARSSDAAPPKAQRRKERSSSPKKSKSSSKKKAKAKKADSSSGSENGSSDSE